MPPSRLRRMRSYKEEAVGVFSRAAASYNAVGPRHFTHFARQVVAFAGVGPGERVLDLATGTGEVLLAAAERCGSDGRLVGIDLTRAMLERAEAAVRARRLAHAELREMDAERLALAAGEFDVVLSAFALSAFPRTDRVFRECRRVLRTGGRLGFLDAPGWYFQHDPRWRWHEEVLRSFGVDQFGGPTEIDAGALLEALAGAGFVACEAAETAFDLVFRDEAEWWAWSWSHGTRRLLEAVPAARREELKRALVRALRSCRGPDGAIHGVMRATMLRAHKP